MPTHNPFGVLGNIDLNQVETPRTFQVGKTNSQSRAVRFKEKVRNPSVYMPASQNEFSSEGGDLNGVQAPGHTGTERADSISDESPVLATLGTPRDESDVNAWRTS